MSVISVILDRVHHVSDLERAARLARRHGLAPGHRHPDPESASRAMTVLHATEAATVHLAVWARVDGVTVADVDRALYDDRSLVKQVAMRRTQFVFPRDLLPAAWGSAAARVAATERARIVKDVVRGGLADDGEAWVDAARAAVLRLLADGEPRPTTEIRALLPDLAGKVMVGTPGKKWGGEVAIGPRVLTLLGVEGLLVKARNDGHWQRNRPTWTRTEDWLGGPPEPEPAEAGYRELVRRWLHTFGPGTETDIVWWLGATKTAVRAALAELGAVQVALERDRTGWLLPDDVEVEAPVEPWAALLPTLDPTVMGWKERDFYLPADLAAYLFDSNGNAGNTAWWDGRIVGAWVQDDDAVVRTVLHADVDPAGRAALADEAERLTAWLDGTRISNVYASPLMKGARLP